jgi:hypothetical protein
MDRRKVQGRARGCMVIVRTENDHIHLTWERTWRGR